MKTEERELLKIGGITFAGMVFLLLAYKAVSFSSTGLTDGIQYVQTNIADLLIPTVAYAVSLTLLVLGIYYYIGKRKMRQAPNLIAIGLAFLALSYLGVGMYGVYDAPSSYFQVGSVKLCTNSDARFNVLPMVDRLDTYRGTGSKLDPFTFQRTKYDIRDGTEYLTFAVDGVSSNQVCTPQLHKSCILRNNKYASVYLTLEGTTEKDMNYLLSIKDQLEQSYLDEGLTQAQWDADWAEYISATRCFNFMVQVSTNDLTAVGECTSGAVKYDNCVDGTQVIWRECVDGQWEATGNECESGGGWLQIDSGGGTEDDTTSRDCTTIDPNMINSNCVCVCRSGYHTEYPADRCVENVDTSCGGAGCAPVQCLAGYIAINNHCVKQNETVEITTGNCSSVDYANTHAEECYGACDEGYVLETTDTGVFCVQQEVAEGEFSLMDYLMENLVFVIITVLALVGGLVLILYALSKRRR